MTACESFCLAKSPRFPEISPLLCEGCCHDRRKTEIARGKKIMKRCWFVRGDYYQRSLGRWALVCFTIVLIGFIIFVLRKG